MKKFLDVKKLLRFDADLPADSLKAGTADLEIRHPDRVFIRHPESQVARGLTQDLGPYRIRGSERTKTVEIAPGVGFVLVIHQAGHTGGENFMALAGELVRDSCRERRQPGTQLHFCQINDRDINDSRCSVTGFDSRSERPVATIWR